MKQNFQSCPTQNSCSSRASLANSFICGGSS
jgi:hypothetical protein